MKKKGGLGGFEISEMKNDGKRFGRINFDKIGTKGYSDSGNQHTLGDRGTIGIDVFK